jgi:hypothetical protein
MYSTLSSCLGFGAVPGHVSLTLPQVGQAAATGAIPTSAAFYLGTGTLVLIASVVWAAVWSKDAERRKAAKDVLDALLEGLERILKAIGSVLRSRTP